MDEQGLGRKRLRQRLAVDGDDALADLRLDADRVERRIGARIPGVAARDVGDLPAAARIVPARRRGEMAERDGGRLAVVAAHFVRMRGAELALHLPDEVGEVGPCRHPVEQRRVEAPDRVPVDARQVGRPELVALQAPDLAQHLAPLAPRLDGDANAVEVDAAVPARRRAVGVGRIAAWARAGGRRRSRAAPCRRDRRARCRRRRSRNRRSSRRASRCGRSRSRSARACRPASLWPPRPCAPTMFCAFQTTFAPVTPAMRP